MLAVGETIVLRSAAHEEYGKGTRSISKNYALRLAMIFEVSV
jgi:hypothetical protein